MSNTFNFNKFNELVSQASDAILCNSECRRKRKEEQLKQKYLNSKTNLATASNQEDIAEKNYIVFTKGETAYNDLLDEKLREKANLISEKFLDNFNEESQKIKSQVTSYSGILVNFRNIVDLYLQYKRENIELFKELKEETNDVLTNERKTYYEDQSIDRLKFFYSYFFTTIYIIFVLCFGSFSMIYPSNYTRQVRLALFIGFILLPFISTWIVGKIIYLLYEIYDLLPKNVYKNP
jgi:hypothetical protein